MLATFDRDSTAHAQAAATSGRFAVESAVTPRDFGELWPDLSNLEAHNNVRAYPFQCRDHLEIWLETVGTASRVKPFFAKVTRRGEPLMLLPLGVRRQAGVRILEFLDCGVADYNAPVLFWAATRLSPEETQALWDSVCRAAPRFDVAVLRKIPEYVADYRNPLYALGTHPCPESGHHIPLGGASAGMVQTMDRREARRCRRRLSEIGETGLRIAGNENEIEEIFAVFHRQKSRQYLETLGHKGFDVSGQRSYCLSLAKKLANRGVELSCLRVGTEIVATAWSLIAGRRFYYMMCSHAGGPWRKFGPGRLLLEDPIERARRDGLDAFDLGIGDESYKLLWSQASLALAGAREPLTARGHFFCAAIAAREALRNRLPLPMRDVAKALLPKSSRSRAAFVRGAETG